MLLFERKLIKELRPICNLMHNTHEPNKGRRLSSESRKKIGNSNRGKKRSATIVARMRAVSTGRRHREETKEKIRIGNTGHLCSPETRKKIGAKVGKANHRNYLIRLIDSQTSRSSTIPY